MTDCKVYCMLIGISCLNYLRVTYMMIKILTVEQSKQECHVCSVPRYKPTHSVTALTIFWSMLILFVFHHFIVKPKKINGDGVFPGVVLLGTSQEGLCEEEARKPEDWRRANFIPLLWCQSTCVLRLELSTLISTLLNKIYPQRLPLLSFR